MAANMPMAANGQMMMQQQQHQMQRQQMSQQMSQQVMQAIMTSHATGGAPWHAQVPIQERLGKTLSFISNLLLAMPQADWNTVTGYGIEAEKKAFLQSADKQAYEATMSQQLAELVKRRQEKAPELQNQLTVNAARQAQLAQQQQQLMMNQMRGINQPGQQSFQHLQHPMQVSQIPQQQTGLGMGMVSPVPMGQNRPDQRPFGMPTGAQPRVPGVPQSINGQTMPRDGAQITPQDKEKVIAQALAKYNQASEAEKQQARQRVQNSRGISTQSLDGRDPALLYYQEAAFHQLRATMQARMMQQLQQRNSGMPPNALQQQQLQQQMRQQQQAGQPGMLNPLGSQPGGGENQLFANMDSIRNEQQMGMIAQANGLPVVPGTTAGRNPTPGPMSGLPTQPSANMPQGLGQMSRSSIQQPFNPAAAQRPQAMNRPPAVPGRPGGLGGPPPNGHSPGMPTINTPMAQPPVPMPQALGQVPNNPQAAAMFNMQFGHQTTPRPTAITPQLLSVYASAPPESRAQVAASAGMPEAKLQELLIKWQQSQGRNNAMSNGAQGLKQQPPPGMGGMLGQSPQGPMANAANQIVVGNASQPVGAMTTPGAPNVQQSLTGINDPRFAAILANPQSQVTMNSMDAPPQLIQQLHAQHNMPPDLRKWGQIKQFASTNLNQQSQAQLANMQVNQFKSLWQSKMLAAGKQQAMAQERQAQVMPNAVQNTPGPIQQVQPQLPQQFSIKVTQQDVERARASNPQVAGMPDNQIITFIRRLKEQEARRAWAQQQQQLQQNNSAANKPTQQAGAVPTPQQTTALPPTPVTASARPAAPQNPSVAHDLEGSAPGSATLKTARPPQSRHTPPNPPPATAPKTGVKRPNSDDAGDASGQSTLGAQRTQPQNDGRPVARQQGSYTPEQIAKFTPEQKQKYAEYLRMQREQQLVANLPQTDEDEKAVRRFAQEEHQSFLADQQAGREREVPMYPEEAGKTGSRILALWRGLQSLKSHLTRHYHLMKDEKKIRQYFRGQFKLQVQFTDGPKATRLRDRLTMSLAEVEEIYKVAEAMRKDLIAAVQKLPMAKNQPSIRQQAASGGNQPSAQVQAQNRAPARPGQAPAAPTTTQPPFAFGNQKSPTGEPTYLGPPKVTHANLNPPPPARKKQKTNPPGQQGQTSSPSIPPGASPQPKVASPDLRRQPVPAPVPETAKPQTNLFPCPEADCEFHQPGSGFPTEETRNAHHQEEHVKPYENPLKFFEDSVGEWASSHAIGSPQNKAGEQETGQLLSQPMKATVSRSGQTPGGKIESAATPMSRDGSMRRQGSAAGSKAPENMATPGKMVGIKSEGTPGLENNKPTGRRDGDIPMGLTDDPWANTTIDPQSLFASYAPMETITGNLLGDFSGYRSSTPNDTPESSKDSGASEPNSDISETANLDIDLNWQPVDESMLVDMSSINMETYDLGAESFQFEGIDDVVTDFSKPFQFDTSLYYMDVV